MRTKAICLVLCAMMASGLIVFVPSTINPIERAEAFPTSDPLPLEYLFYDDFENTSTNYFYANTTWTIPTLESLYAPHVDTTHVYHGNYAAHFDVVTSSKCIRRSFGGINSNVCIELWYWENASDTTQGTVLKISNATTAIQFGIRTSESTTKYDFRLNSVGSWIVNYARATAWTNLKLLLIDGKVRGFINNDYVGERPLVNPTTYEFRSDTATSDTWIDQFCVYRLYQDAIWDRPVSTTAIVTYNNSWSKKTIAEPNVLYENGVYKMWYRGVNYSNIPKLSHPTGLGYATSPDGITWTEYYDNPLTGIGWCPTVRKIAGTYYLFDSSTYGGIWRFAIRNSANGITWSAVQNTDLTIGSGTWDDQYLGNCDVWVESGTWYMLYEASNLTSSWKIGLATSSNGINWTKYAGNPIIGNASITAGGPDIEKINGVYYCWYHKGGGFTEIALKESTDLHTWTESSFHIQLPRDPVRPKESLQTADPWVISNAAGTGSFLYFTGVSNATNGEIFYASSIYTLSEISNSEILQWGKQWIGDLGVTNNITAPGSRTYWYSGINAMKGNYFYDWNVTWTSGELEITINSWNPTSSSTVANWNAASSMPDTSVTYTIGSLSADVGYKVYKDGEEIAQQYSGQTSLTFTSSGNGTYTIEVWSPESMLVHELQWSLILPLLVVLVISILIGAAIYAYETDNLDPEKLIVLIIGVVVTLILIACLILVFD